MKCYLADDPYGDGRRAASCAVFSSDVLPFFGRSYVAGRVRVSYRHRRCSHCGSRFSTQERPVCWSRLESDRGVQYAWRDYIGGGDPRLLEIHSTRFNLAPPVQRKSDASSVRCSTGTPLATCVYLAVILDAFSRRQVGWALGRTLQDELMLEGLSGHHLPVYPNLAREMSLTGPPIRPAPTCAPPPA